MACPELDASQLFSNHQSFDSPFNLQLESSTSAEILAALDPCTSSRSQFDSIPKPPPLPGAAYCRTKFSRRIKDHNCIPEETRHAWDKLFLEGYGADVWVHTDDGSMILAHSSVLGINSPMLRGMLEEARVKSGFKSIKIPGVHPEAARLFIRFLYSSRYEQDGVKKYAFHLLVLAHIFLIPSLKRICINQLEQALTTDNVVDVLQLARQCDAPRLSLLSTRMIVKDFKTISVSEGWKVMKQANPSLEQELLESLVEEDSIKLERTKKIEQRKIYTQLYEAMEALLHICQDGCRTIGPRDKVLKDGQSTCNFPACKVLESLVRHFSGCKTRVPGGCASCKRMWQLLELHSCMCSKPETCKVPLCRHFKDKMQHLSKKEEMKWKLLASKVLSTKGTISSICNRRPLVS